MIARGHTLGAITLSLTGAAREFDEEDLAVAQDLAYRAALSIDNARLYAQSREEARMREEFLTVASHELRTPLTSLDLNLQNMSRALARAPLPKDHASDLGTRLAAIGRSATRIGDLVAVLLDVTRVRAGRLELQVESFDLAALTREVLARTVDLFTRAGCPITLRADQAVLGVWDRGRVDQILTNLLSNAAKYGRGSPVEISVEEDGDRAILKVRDYGIGLSDEEQRRIFGRFERAASARHFGGLGLGLWIVRQVVDAHGGEIRVESTKGTGALFEVALPRLVEQRAG
jgi:signal transduction histidine kinase